MPARLPKRLLVALLVAGSLPAVAQTVQQHVHEHGHQVMPFDLARSVHVFEMTQDGGIQQVVTRVDPPDPEQLRLIRQHLQAEAEAFRKGDFADPAHLHGPGMPGLKELQAGAGRLEISYRPLPNGAEIRFRSSDIGLVTAVHRWFGAQLSEHGADAKAQ